MPESWEMRRAPLAIALLVVLPGCVGSGAGVTSASTSPEPTSQPTVTTSTVTTTTIDPNNPPVAWIAPSGVPMAVTGLDGSLVGVLTPCGAAGQLSHGTPVYDVDVVIDPGHGGPIDTGAVARTGLTEKEVNLRVGMAVARLLNDRGVATMLTRAGDYPVPIPTRSDYADMVGAEVLVSIHHNAPAAPSSDIPGVEIFIQQGSADSMRLGGLLYESAMATLGGFDVAWQRAADAGVMTVLNPGGIDAYGMVRLPETVSVLVELGYIANQAEAGLYARPVYAESVGASIADAVEAFLTTDEPGSGFVDGRVFRPGRGVGADQCIEPDLESSLYPDVVGAEVRGEDGLYSFDVTVSSDYDTPQRYADAWRVIGEDGVVYGVNELTHDHVSEQPFTRSMIGVEIPATVGVVTIEARDQVYGWGGATVSVKLP